MSQHTHDSHPASAGHHLLERQPELPPGQEHASQPKSQQTESPLVAEVKRLIKKTQKKATKEKLTDLT